MIKKNSKKIIIKDDLGSNFSISKDGPIEVSSYHKEIKSEKFILRKAFSEEVCGEKYLPDEILWRQKEQFSDGVGYSWIDGLLEFTKEIMENF